MQSKPRTPAQTTETGPRPRGNGTTARIGAWIRRRRRAAAGHLLRGLCTGTGAGIAGLAFWWLEKHL